MYSWCLLPKEVWKEILAKLSAKDAKCYICEGILADIFYLSGSTSYLYTQKVYKNINHLKNVCQSALCADIETNPGPVFYIDPSKTISAPYSQGNQIIFGETAGQQCLAMCLCTLIYYKRPNICTPQDPVHIMNIGNELYSNLSCLARQSFLLLTELPSQLTIQFLILLLSHVLTGIQTQYSQFFTLALLCVTTLGYICLVIYLERLNMWNWNACKIAS